MSTGRTVQCVSRRRCGQWSASVATVITTIVCACGMSITTSLADNSVNLTLLGMNISDDNVSTTLSPTLSPTPTTPEPEDTNGPDLEHFYSMMIFFLLLVIAICIFVVHLLIQTNFHYLPESIAIVLVGAVIGFISKLMAKAQVANWKAEEHFQPTMFFLLLLPPIIFESGYNLHKGNFFQNIGSILLFAIFGTVISAVIVGGGIYLLGLADVVYPLTLAESFAFGSLIAAVDPVATLAIFSAMDVDPVLYMLVFGESILNDAVAIVLTNTVMSASDPAQAGSSGAVIFFGAVGKFSLMFLASSAIGLLFGLLSAIVLKFVDIRKTPSLEFCMLLVFSYAPYGLAEGLELSGIMAILSCAIVMSHYTHQNLSPVTQIVVQQTWRAIAFMAETSVFAYLGLAIFSYKHEVEPALVIWSIILILLGRAANIFPLSSVTNYFREHKITRRMQFTMWFSGLRGAIAFALALHLDFPEKTRRVLVTTTLIVVLFTILFLGGSTMPLMKFLNRHQRKKTKEVTLSKTKEYGDAVDSEIMSEYTEDELDPSIPRPALKGFLKIDVKYLMPFFTRRLTKQEAQEGRKQMTRLANQWYEEVRSGTMVSEVEEEDDDEVEETQLDTSNIHKTDSNGLVVPGQM